MWAFLLAVVGIGVTVAGTQTSAFLFDWDSGEALAHRDRVVVGVALLAVSAVIWWALQRRVPAVVLGAIAVVSVTVAFAAPGSLFLLALASPVVVILGVGVAIVGLATGAGRPVPRLVWVTTAGGVLATAAVLGLAPALGLIGVIGAVVAGGAVAALIVRGDRGSAVDPD